MLVLVILIFLFLLVQERRDVRPSGQPAPVLVLRQVAEAARPLMGKATATAIAAGQSAAATAVAAGQAAAASAVAAGQFCGDRVATVAQVGLRCSLPHGEGMMVRRGVWEWKGALNRREGEGRGRCGCIGRMRYLGELVPAGSREECWSV